MNCWDYKQCGHDRTGGCPAYPKHGETCFYVAGTLCENKVQGDYAKKIQNCRKECDYYAHLMSKSEI